MRVETLVLHNFRNYQYIELALDAYLNIFVGANAQGKTNLWKRNYAGFRTFLSHPE